MAKKIADGEKKCALPGGTKDPLACADTPKNGLHDGKGSFL